MSSMEFKGGEIVRDELLRAKVKMKLPIGKQERIGSALFIAFSSIFIIFSLIAMFFTGEGLSDVIVFLVVGSLFLLIGIASFIYYLADFYLVQHEDKLYKIRVKGSSVKVELEVPLSEAEAHLEEIRINRNISYKVYISINGKSLDLYSSQSYDLAKDFLRELVAHFSIPAVDHVGKERLENPEEALPLWMRAELERKPETIEPALKKLGLPYKLANNSLEIFIEAPKGHNASVIFGGIILLIIGLLFSGSAAGIFIGFLTQFSKDIFFSIFSLLILGPVFILGILAIYNAIFTILKGTGRGELIRLSGDKLEIYTVKGEGKRILKESIPLTSVKSVERLQDLSTIVVEMERGTRRISLIRAIDERALADVLKSFMALKA